MKYIDADRLKAEIEKTYKSEIQPWLSGVSATSAIYDYVLPLIDSLQQEQPESSKGKFVFPNFLYARTVDNKTIDVSYAPQSMDAVEYIKNDPTEQPEVDLEKELDQWRHKHFAGERDGHYSGEYLERSSQLEIARHFYNLGLNARKED